ncbi:MAG: hypothetical protein LBO74_12045 [Candidatus Symbiothrix sp.]|jgi:hypothetical protein|nr:hypothetical protein [Candidatus Symbiothrix sp.]
MNGRIMFHKQGKVYMILTCIIVFLLAISTGFLVKDYIPVVLNATMLASPLILCFVMHIYRQDLLLGLFLVTIFLFPVLFHPESLRWSTIFYSAMFSMNFMAYERVFDRARFLPEQYLNLLKFLLYAYFVVLLIQQFCVLTGLSVFMGSAYNPAEPWKLNSLAMEPSWAARIVPLLMYSFITLKEIIKNRKYSFKEDFKKDKYIWIAFLWTMITMGSGTAFLFIPIVLLKFIRGKNIIYMLLIASMVWVAANAISPTTLKRTTDTVMATLTLDEHKIIETDGAAASRIVPMIIAMKTVDISTFDDWFGHGIDYTNRLYGILPGTLGEGVGGAMFLIWIEYGFISFILFVVFSSLMCWRKGDILSIIFWFFLVFMYGVNNQIVWLCIILLYTNKLFITHKRNILYENYTCNARQG